MNLNKFLKSNKDKYNKGAIMENANVKLRIFFNKINQKVVLKFCRACKVYYCSMLNIL